MDHINVNEDLIGLNGLKMNIANLQLSPGIGWTHLGGAVYEHISGTRIHIGGMVKLLDNTYLSLNNCHENELGNLLVAINGGNRKRGLMAWAVNLTYR